jgi:hypothetical protein
MEAKAAGSGSIRLGIAIALGLRAPGGTDSKVDKGGNSER